MGTHLDQAKARFGGRPRGVIATLVVAVTAAAFSVVGSPAHASPAGFAWKDYFAELCQWGCAANGGPQVQFWQSVLWADNINGRIGSLTFIDGQFGPNTGARTRDWQAVPYHLDHEGRRLSVDGRVGPRTWSAADRTVPAIACETQPNLDQVCTYYGVPNRSFRFGLEWLGTRSSFWFVNPRTGHLVRPLA